MPVEQHAHHEYATHKDLNGFGKRVTDVEGDTRENTVRSKRNEDDITRLFDLAAKNTEGLHALKESTAHLVGKITGYVAGATAAVLLISEVIKYFLGR